MSVTHDRASLHVLPTSEARKRLPEMSRGFAEKGVSADPVFFGAHRKPAGVMLSYALYLKILDRLDDAAIAVEVRKRDNTDSGERMTLEDLIRSQGFEPTDFGLTQD